jgi:hypothetical protein
VAASNSSLRKPHDALPGESLIAEARLASEAVVKLDEMRQSGKLNGRFDGQAWANGN